jgi:lipoic acid synthetase
MTARALPIVDDAGAPASAALPSWLAAPAASAPRVTATRAALGGLGTVCEAARCPNQAVCWSEGTATVMVMGPVCTRACRFCHVPHGRPQPLDPDEPERLARFVRAAGLRHVVITSVNRDDLADHGAGHLAACVAAIVQRGDAGDVDAGADADQRVAAGVTVEVLIPDLGADATRIGRIVDAGASIVAHNVETVPRLSRALRDRRATYATSLGALRAAKRERRDVLTKSSLMLGLGEDDDEVIDALIDLRAADVDIVTLGQYLRPSRRHARVARWVDPARFDDFAADARSLGFRAVASGPLVRSSYRAAELAALAGADRYRARPHRVER